ncbi:hypothetical protein [Streptomyces sp. SID13726]|uniref:VMAP-C domain-containing protein n=1 Tax=Streptomyces sp. SID13726 TaxID=2706058 RepID=UPI001EF20BA8|nr:hypothetical protein [Streptomyces sp. SID13726]
MPDREPYGVPEPATVARLADALMKVTVLNDLEHRRLCVQETMERLQLQVSVTESPQKKIHVVSMVRQFGSVPRGWQALTDAVQFLADYDLPSVHAASLVQPVALPVFTDVAEHELQALLAGLDRTSVPELAELYRAASGAHFGPLPDPVNTAWDAHQLLAHINQPSDGVPRSVRFLQDLAAGLSQEQREAIRTWIGRQVRSIADDPEVARRILAPAHSDAGRPRAGETRPAHLVLRLNPSMSSPEFVDVTCWINVGSRWEPRRRDERSVPREQLRRHVAMLVNREEIQLRNHRGGIVLEFILPVPLLNEPVEEWPRIGLPDSRPLWPSEHGGPPFWQDYTVVVRSLERIEARQFHRVWNERWHVLAARPGEARAHHCGVRREEESHRLYLHLKENPAVVLMALGAPPDQQQGRRELLMGLEAGLPLLVWSHHGPLPEQTQHAMESALSDPLDRLLDHMVRLRAVPGPKDDGYAGGDTSAGIAVLWDDPNRLPDFPEPVLSSTQEAPAERKFDL